MYFKIEKQGDWDRVARILSGIKKVCFDVRKEHLKKLSEKGLEIVQGHIDNQDLNHEPLGDPYKAWKAKQGLSTDILKATGRYRESIEAMVSREAMGVGVRHGERSLSGEDMSMIAAVHEYGSMGQGIPERPLWAPSFEELFEWWEKEGFPAYDIIDRLKTL